MTKTKEPSKFGLTDVFSRFASKAVADFPQLQNKFLLYDMLTDTVHGSTDGKAAETAAVERVKECVEKFRKEGSPPEAFAGHADDYYHIAYINSNPERPQIDVIRTLEHELGHLVAPGGAATYQQYTHNFHECVADAFSFLRMQKTPLRNKSRLQARAWARSSQLVFDGKIKAFTLPVLKELALLLQSYDCSGLTPVQTANIAYRLALQYTPSDNRLSRGARIFSPVGRIYNCNTALEASLRKCAEIMFSDHGKDSAMAFTIGKTVLEPFLYHRPDILPLFWQDLVIKQNFRLEGTFWNDIRAKIKIREEQAKESPEQALAHKLDHMQVLGYFDRDPDKLIDLRQYESTENQAYIRQKRAACAAMISVKLPPPTPPSH